MKSARRAATVVALMGVVSLPLSLGAGPGGGFSPIGSAHAQGFLKNLIARLRGETLPAGIVKSNGRIEATQVDVSSKYAGRLAEVTVEEGSSVTQGQVVAENLVAGIRSAAARRAGERAERQGRARPPPRRRSPSRQSALEFAKSDFERGAGADEDRLHHQADLRAAQAQLRFGGRRGRRASRSQRDQAQSQDQEFGSARSSGSNRSSTI